jgi:YVTN family beta-propeller protein
MTKLYFKKFFSDPVQAAKTLLVSAKDYAQLAELRAKETKDSAEETKCDAEVTKLHVEIDRLEQRIIIPLLKQEWRRITAWNQIQEKKKEGEYPTIRSVPICSEGFFIALTEVLMFLEAKAKLENQQAMFAYVRHFENNFSVISTISDVVIAIIPLETIIGITKSGKIVPERAVIFPDGTRIYQMDRFKGIVFVISTANHTVIAPIPVKRYAHGIAITPDGTTIYVTQPFNSSVAVISTANNKVTTTIPVDSCPREIAITPDGKQVYVVHGTKDTVSAIDTKSKERIALIPVGKNPSAIAITPDGRSAYVTGDHGISVIDTAKNTVIYTISCKRIQEMYPVMMPLEEIAISPDGMKIYTTAHDSPEKFFIFVISTLNNSLIDTIEMHIDRRDGKIARKIIFGHWPG